MDKDLSTEQQIPSGVLRAITFGILTEQEARNIQYKEIKVANEVTDPALGLPNPTNKCDRCGAKDGKSCEGHFGIIDFSATIINPFFISDVAKILNKICPGCKSVRRDKVKSADLTSSPRQQRKCKYCNGSSKGLYPTMKFCVSSKDVFGKTAIIAEANKKSSKQKSFGENLAPDYWDIIPHDSQLDGLDLQLDGMNLKSNTRRIISPAQAHSILKDVDPKFLEVKFKRKSSIFLNCLLVTPNNHRVTEFGQHMVFDESTKIYRKLIDFRGIANELNSRVLDRIKCSKLRAEKQENKVSDGPSYGSKHIKELILAKRNDHIFRMVVVGDPNIKLSELGIPCHIAERLKISDHINPWNWNQLRTFCELMILGKGEVTIRRGGDLVCLRSIDDLQRGDIVYRPLIDGDIVLTSRPPSIHQHSLIALSVKILPVASALSVNPLICSPLRGDFDGDCLHGFVPQSVDAKVELQELVALDKQLIDGQSGRNLLSLSQDSLTAAYLILEDGVFLNQLHMQQLQMFCPQQLQLPAFIKAITPNTCLWTGKQLFSLLFPSGLNYDFPPNGVHIREGQLLSSAGISWLRDANENLVHTLAKKFKVEALDFLYAAQEVLCEWLSLRGLSVSLSDLYLTSDEYIRQNLLDEVSYGLQEAQMHSHIRLVMVDGNEDFLARNSEENHSGVNYGVEHMSCEQQKSAALSQVSVATFKQVFWDIQNLIYPYANKDNTLLVMLKAGSKGNLLKLVQQSMCLGLQQSLVPLSFRLPHQLSCSAWNNQKTHISDHKSHHVPEHSGSYIPCAVVGNSFLTGLNPLECFVHSLISRDSSFGGHADVAGTLSRRLMYFMRDLCITYDGTVRNAYGNCLVQFSYASNKDGISSPGDDKAALKEDVFGTDVTGGHPVGALAACAISEAAYSALDQPFSALESSPLLNFKKALECGVKKRSGPKSASLYLSKKLGRHIYGSEHGALDVKSHLERLLFSDIVSSVMIFFSPGTSNRTPISPWVCHFHMDKEVAQKRGLRLQSIIDALRSKYDSFRVKVKAHLPTVKIVSPGCSEVDVQNESNAIYCITVALAESSKNSSKQLDILRDTVIPFLLGIVIKGYLEFKKVEILWKDEARCPKGSTGEMYLRSSGELYIRVFMSEICDRTKFWKALLNRCLGIWDLIDWERSHPDDVQDMATVYGVDVAWKHFLNNLKSAVGDVGKNILPEHLVLVADCLASTGELLPLSAKGIALQRKETSISTPFVQACLSNPGDNLIKAAKLGVTDKLDGSVEAISWGRTPSIGTGTQFDILYAGKGYEPEKPTNVYSLLSCHAGSVKEAVKVELLEEQNKTSAKSLEPSLFSKTLISKTNLRSFLSANDIMKLSRKLKYILHKYDIDCRISEVDKSVVMMALYFHPRRKEKIGSGANEIKVGYHSKHGDSRCFLLVRTDGTVEDFSYHKCVQSALELIAPQKAKLYRSKW